MLVRCWDSGTPTAVLVVNGGSTRVLEERVLAQEHRTMPPQVDGTAIDEAAISRSAFAPKSKTSTNATTSGGGATTSAPPHDGSGDSGIVSEGRDGSAVNEGGGDAGEAARMEEKGNAEEEDEEVEVEEEKEQEQQQEEGDEGEIVEGETVPSAPVDLDALETRLAAEKAHQEQASAGVNLLKALGAPPARNAAQRSATAHTTCPLSMIQ